MPRDRTEAGFMHRGVLKPITGLKPAEHHPGAQLGRNNLAPRNGAVPLRSARPVSVVR
jgi:hypothetical protein